MTIFAKLTKDGLTEVREIKQADLQRCRFTILTAEHYRTDGSCKCDDPEHRAMMIREWGYKAKDFKGIPLREPEPINSVFDLPPNSYFACPGGASGEGAYLFDDEDNVTRLWDGQYVTGFFIVAGKPVRRAGIRKIGHEEAVAIAKRQREAFK